MLQNAAMGPEHLQPDLHPALSVRVEPLQKYTHDFRNISHGGYFQRSHYKNHQMNFEKNISPD